MAKAAQSGNPLGSVSFDEEAYWAERRTSPRANVRIKCWIERESVTLFGTVINLSSGGVFLRVPALIARGRTLDLRMETDDGPVIASGTVVWASGSSCSKKVTGLGIRFEELAKGHSVLRGVIEKSAF